MPVYHFTFHAYGTWMPDHPKGYVRRNQGVLPPNAKMADQYRRNMKQPTTQLTADIQRLALDTLIAAQAPQRIKLYAVATEDVHLHLIIGWDDDRDPIRVRANVKSSLTRVLNQTLGKRRWFARNAGQTRVKGHKHLHHLAHVYLPTHPGLFWRSESLSTSK
jgi:REP element-mobilizing transposase RayT